jgi:hypothetical protein
MDDQIENLIQDFVRFTENHYKATIVGDWREANKNAKKVHKTFLHIVKLGIEGREALLALTENESSYVALMAATYSLKYNTEKALATLKKFTNTPGFAGFGAQQTIKRWDEGTWQLE